MHSPQMSIHALQKGMEPQTMDTLLPFRQDAAEAINCVHVRWS